MFRKVRFEAFNWTRINIPDFGKQPCYNPHFQDKVAQPTINTSLKIDIPMGHALLARIFQKHILAYVIVHGIMLQIFFCYGVFLVKLQTPIVSCWKSAALFKYPVDFSGRSILSVQHLHL
ncbi:hypothetical protein BY458DRAFT_486431 [Sporodiniella umbellata]|nr:hypothetical protein BY458DRAFT_486431 [Sporodiniella umbellata]